jgi:hypothetical protein
VTLQQLDVDLDYAEGNYLKPNGLGGYIISVSALQSWSRCQLQRFYELRARHDPEAPQGDVLSASAYGNVVHYALQAMELAMHEGREDALEVGLRTFEHYWHPDNITAVTPRITEWLPRQTYGGLRERGRLTIRDHHSMLQSDKSYVLGLEYPFAVPIEIRGRVHTLHGFVDRLAIRQHYRKPYVSLDDNKTGKQPTFLRYHMQGTVYGYASTLPEFWCGWPESGLGEMEHFDEAEVERLEKLFASWDFRLHRGLPGDEPLASRRFRWINLQEIKFADGGWRTEQDYARMFLGVDAYVRSSEAGIYSVNTTGEVCRYCSFRKDCGGVGLPHETAGAP